MSEEKEQVTESVEVVSQDITMSEDIGKLAEALAKAQGKLGSAHKNKSNPFFKSSYSDLDSCWDACRDVLSANNLAVTQCHREIDGGDLVLDTFLLHSSGQFMKGTIKVRPTKNDPQMFVSATTYARRAGLCAMVGISPSDDDGNAASGKTSATITKTKPKAAPVNGKGKGKTKTETKAEPETASDDSDDDF